MLLRGLITAQYFTDGNKRTAWAAAEAFIELNGEELGEIDDDEAETFALEVVAHRHDVEAIAIWLLERATSLPESLDATGVCDFCGATADLPGAELLPRVVMRAAGYRSDHALQSFHDVREGIDLAVTPFRPDFDLVPGVCWKCRRGWMALVDSQGIPALLQLMETGKLPAAARRHLAAWAVKTALLRSSLEPALPPAWRTLRATRVRQSGRPSPGWTVWAAVRDSGPDDIGRLTFVQVVESRVTPEGDRYPTSLQHTLLAGRLVLVTCYDHPDLSEDWAAAALRDAVDAGAVRPIWPGNGAASLAELPVLDPQDVDELRGLLMHTVEAAQEDDAG